MTIYQWIKENKQALIKGSSLMVLLSFLLGYYVHQQLNTYADKVIVTDLKSVLNNINTMSKLRKYQEEADDFFKEAKWVVGKDARLLANKVESLFITGDKRIHNLSRKVDLWNKEFGDIDCKTFVTQLKDPAEDIEDRGNNAFLALSEIEDDARTLLFDYSKPSLDFVNIVISGLATFISLLTLHSLFRKKRL